MRWEILNKSWKLARDKFPNVKSLYVDLPRKFRSEGTCSIYDLEAFGDPLGKISYASSAEGGLPVVTVQLEDATEQVTASRISRQCRVAIAWNPPEAPPEIDLALIRKGCRDGFEFGRRLALLFLSGKDEDTVRKEDVRDWLRAHGADANMVVPTAACLEDMGFPVVESENGSFNLRTAMDEQVFKEHDRVRVIHPTSMEYQECGLVTEIKGSAKDGFWYAVLVDGSEAPMWFPKEALDHDEAGQVVDPIVEPVDA